MFILPALETVEPFSKIVVDRQADGRLAVKAAVLLERVIEGAVTGVAIDGSGTMMPWFGAQGGQSQNIVAPFAQSMCAYLAGLSGDGLVATIYWATGGDGRSIEEVGRLSAEEATHYAFKGPRVYGNHTCLLPALTYFVNAFQDAPWSLVVFITDGRLDDLEDVKRATVQIAQAISQGRTRSKKFILVGVGHRIDESQLIELDNLDTGTEQDLWDYKVAKTMKHLAEIFAELVDEHVIVAERGLIRDDTGAIIRDYRDVGVPALMKFMLSSGATAFSLEVDDQVVVQPLALPRASSPGNNDGRNG